MQQGGKLRNSHILHSVALCAALLASNTALAGEVQSPEQFLTQTYGWTIKGLDNERGLFGDYRAFACFDDRIGQPKTEQESLKRRWGTQCQTVRASSENLGAMIFLSWTNPRHPKPQTAAAVFDFTASQMAGSQKDQGYDAKCGAPEQVERAGKRIAIYDCVMVLPFGSYYASFVQFQHRDFEYFIRVQNASSAPIANVPNRTARKIAAALAFD